MRNLLLTFTALTLPFLGLAQETISAQSNPIYLDLGKENRDLGEEEIEFVWITPSEQKITSFNRTYQLKMGVNSGSEITDTEISVNDQPLIVRGLDVVKKTGYDQFDRFIEQDIRLREGDNLVSLTVENYMGKKHSESRIINVPEEDKEILARTDYALLIATDEYDYWGDLSNPVNDARTIAEELEKNYRFKVEMITNATTDEMLIKLREYAQKNFLPYDQLFIFIAGHGQYDEAFGEGYIVGKNSEVQDDAKTSYLSHSVLRNVVNNIPAEHTFLTMDVCFGGTFDPEIAKATHRGLEAQYEEISQSEYLKRKMRYKTRRYVTSGGKEYVPDGRPGMHSPFARKFIEGLRSYGSDDRVLTLAELFNYLEKINPEPRTGEFGSNEAGSDFVFVAR